MTAGEKLAAWLIGVFAGLSRLFAMSKTPWDSDEGRFMSALRHYDVTVHHPHPPGFPLFMAFAKAFSFLGEFRALQLVSLIAAIAIVPAAIFCGRAIGFSMRVTLIGATFLAFFPNVWYFGGTAFSDVPSMTLSLVAIGLLLRGQWIAGAIVAGVAAGFRPQALLIVAIPALIGIPFKKLIAFAIIVATIVIASYGAAAHFSGGWPRYRQALADHEQYIATHDSFRAPLRPPMWELFDNFFIRPYDARAINIIVALLVAMSLVRPKKPMLILIATFAPFCLAAWALLDRFSTSRFSIGYAPLIAFLAAYGIDLLRPRAAIIGAAIVVAIMIAWTWPALTIVHRTSSPPFSAADFVKHQKGVAYVAAELSPIFDALLATTPHVNLPPGPPPLTAVMNAGDVYVREGASGTPGAVVFARERGHLAAIARSTRYFEVSVIPIRAVMQFDGGWYPPESSWRWMARRATITLPPRLERMRLSLNLYVPLDALPSPPNITITFNGRVLDRVHGNIEKDYDVVAPIDRPSELTIETDETVNPSAHAQADTRELGVRLNAISWQAR